MLQGVVVLMVRCNGRLGCQLLECPRKSRSSIEGLANNVFEEGYQDPADCMGSGCQCSV